MTARRPALFLVALLLVTAGLAGCGDDGDDDTKSTTTTEATTEDEATTTEAPADDETTTTEAPADDETTTTEAPADGETTTSAAEPPNDASLEALLLDPATLGPDYVANDSLGNGSLEPDLCEGTTLQGTWDAQASQALMGGGQGPESVIFQQAVLRFADAAAAEAFTTELTDALVACQPGTEVETLTGIGDEAYMATADEEQTGSVAVAGVIRVGAVVGWHVGFAGPGGTAPLDQAILEASAERLAG